MKLLLRWPVLWWLRLWARLALARINPFIIGVTGSAGKTSAVEAIRHVAALKFKRVKVAEKANSESGIPADILGLHFTDYSFSDWLRICVLAPIQFRGVARAGTPPSAWTDASRETARPQRGRVATAGAVGRGAATRQDPGLFDCYVVELGVDEPTPPKNMGYLLTILKPHIGVILNALPVHALQFGEQLGLTDQKEIIAAIAGEKGRLVTENSNLQTAILNADQPEITSLKPHNSACILTFGKSKNADVVVESVKPSLDGTTIEFRFKGPGPTRPGPANSQGQAFQELALRLPNFVLPDFFGSTFASALAVGLALDIDPKNTCAAISKSFKLPPGRGQIFRGINNTTIIDSSYNASRETMIGSLRLLRATCHERGAIGILGDMRELGNQAKTEHEAVAHIAAETLDEAILVGPLMKQYVLPVLEKKIPTHWFLTAGETSRFLLEVSQTSSAVILVKGSQNAIFLEIVVEALLADKKDVSKLCRRGNFWDRQRIPFR